MLNASRGSDFVLSILDWILALEIWVMGQH